MPDLSTGSHPYHKLDSEILNALRMSKCPSILLLLPNTACPCLCILPGVYACLIIQIDYYSTTVLLIVTFQIHCSVTTGHCGVFYREGGQCMKAIVKKMKTPKRLALNSHRAFSDFVLTHIHVHNVVGGGG